MKRRMIAAGLLAALSLPLAAGAALLSCCVLPFHRVVHQVAPLCHVAIEMAGDAGERDDETPAPRAPEEKMRPLNLRVSRLTADVVLPVVAALAASPAAHRSFVALGGLRCEDDVGRLRLLIATQRI